MTKLADSTTAGQDTKPVTGGPTDERPPILTDKNRLVADVPGGSTDVRPPKLTERNRLVAEVPGGSTEEPPVGAASLAPNGGGAEGNQGNGTRG